MTRKLIAFDIDGTLLDSHGRVLPSTVTALEKLRQAGHLVTIASGRSRFLAQEILTRYHFENYLLVNGAAAFINHQQVVKKVLDTPELDRLIAFATELGIDVSYQNLDEIHRYQAEILPTVQQAMDSFRAQVPSHNPEFYHTHEIYQAIAYYDASFDEQFAAADFQQFDLVRWHPSGVDIIPKNNSKAAGLIKMAEIAKIAHEDIIVFGDGLNDREMLRLAGVGVAMGNASAEVKDSADLVTADNNSDGIYQALQQLALL